MIDDTLPLTKVVFSQQIKGDSTISNQLDVCVDPQIPGYGQTIPESSSCTCQHHLNVAQEPSRLL